MIKPVWVACLLTGTALAMFGCGTSDSTSKTAPAAPPVAQVEKAAPPLVVVEAALQAPVQAPVGDAQDAPTDAATEEGQVETRAEMPLTYNPEGKRDPFRSLIRPSTGKKEPDANAPPLERAELRELRLTGIVWDDADYAALIQTPDGKGYGAKVGTRMGLNNGIVSRITSKDLAVEEKSVDILGKVHVVTHVLELHPKKEGLE